MTSEAPSGPNPIQEARDEFAKAHAYAISAAGQVNVFQLLVDVEVMKVAFQTLVAFAISGGLDREQFDQAITDAMKARAEQLKQASRIVVATK